jgi:hypothetical protein
MYEDTSKDEIAMCCCFLPFAPLHMSVWMAVDVDTLPFMIQFHI